MLGIIIIIVNFDRVIPLTVMQNISCKWTWRRKDLRKNQVFGKLWSWN